MNRNIYVAYILWFFLGNLGVHRIYFGKILSGLGMLALFWIGCFTAVFFIGFIFLAIWGVWWLIDAYLISEWLSQNSTNQTYPNYTNKLDHIEKLYNMYKDGKISKEEYEKQKDTILNN